MSGLMKKISLLVILAAALGGGIYLVSRSAQKGSAVYIAPTDLDAILKSPALTKDSDGDGLRDWEESLWKTDPYNPDTAGDGVPDGKKVKEGRNPLLPGPDNVLDAAAIKSKVNPQTESDLTDTEKFSRELFVKIIAASKTPAGVNSADYSAYLSSTLQHEVETNRPIEFTSENFKTTADGSPAALASYGNAVAAILTEKPAKPLEHELVIVERAAQDGSESELAKLDDNIAEYRLLEGKLAALAVPKPALAAHLALVNSIADMIWSLSSMRFVLSDPIKAIPGISKYLDNEEGFLNSIRALGAFFSNQDVQFSPADRGYELFHTI